MAGFYIHIPFCKKVCYYCDFHFVATLKYKDDMLDAMHEEIRSRASLWKSFTFSTLYFGGGTPSVLSVDEINRLEEEIRKHYNFKENIEYTLEANPDDLTTEYLKNLKQHTEINRLSIGTQSFHNRDLKLMNRRHNGEEAYSSIARAMQHGFTNLNIDLIYGVPGLSDSDWEANIARFIELKAPHLSAYHLTFEPKTVFDHMRKKNKLKPVNEEISQQHYAILVEQLKNNGYEHYEVSNFALEGYRSQHNTNYWKNKPYIGIGPSAHSFIGNQRTWNIANNTKYCEALFSGNSNYITREELSPTTHYNEYVITSLRTAWGFDQYYVNEHIGIDFIEHTNSVLSKFKEGEHFVYTEKGFALTEKGWLISDYIMREFMLDATL
jgi:oxygen-independent coproporphyrinogen-3 oxidase